MEGHNFDIRKHLLEYDDVMNKQREVIYSQRRAILEGTDVHALVADIMQELVAEIAAEFAQSSVPAEEWDWQGLDERLLQQFNLKLGWNDEEKQGLRKKADLQAKVQEAVDAAYAGREQGPGVPA